MRSHFVDAVCSCGWREPLTVYGPPVLQAIGFCCPRCSLRWRLVGGEDLVDGAWAEDDSTAEPAAATVTPHQGDANNAPAGAGTFPAHSAAGQRASDGGCGGQFGTTPVVPEAVENRDTFDAVARGDWTGTGVARPHVLDAPCWCVPEEVARVG